MPVIIHEGDSAGNSAVKRVIMFLQLAYVRDHGRGAAWTNTHTDAGKRKKLVRSGSSSTHLGITRGDCGGARGLQRRRGWVTVQRSTVAAFIKHEKRFEWLANFFPFHLPAYFFFCARYDVLRETDVTGKNIRTSYSV
jgi:hypothetical protein